MCNEGLPIDTNMVVPYAREGLDMEDILHRNPWPAVNSTSHDFVLSDNENIIG
jgi:hypothetical protein